MTPRALFLLPLCLAACSNTPKVSLSDPWPAKPPDYQEAHRLWTRHGSARREVHVVMDAYATLKSAELRASHVAEAARRRKLTPDERKALAAAERAELEQYWDVHLRVSTHDADWNDLHKESRSVWRLLLVGDGGRSVAPLEVKRDRRPTFIVEQWHPDLTQFHRSYLVRFPRTTADGEPLVSGRASRLELRIGSDLGNVTLSWGNVE